MNDHAEEVLVGLRCSLANPFEVLDSLQFAVVRTGGVVHIIRFATADVGSQDLEVEAWVGETPGKPVFGTQTSGETPAPGRSPCRTPAIGVMGISGSSPS
jgi:hypothetical protein